MDRKLFRVVDNKVQEISQSTSDLEKPLQQLFEANLEVLIGVRFVASEYSIGGTPPGRIDSLGIDENGCPVVIEYKRSTNDNVINQGLFYVDWLLDHRKDFEWLVVEKFGAEALKDVDWSATRLVCVAGGFSPYDERAVRQIERNIELIQYRMVGHDLLLLELLVARAAKAPRGASESSKTRHSLQNPIEKRIGKASLAIRKLYDELKKELLEFGDDVQVKTLRQYIAFTRIKNFACVEVIPTKNHLLVYAKLDPRLLTLEPGFTRDVTNVGHFGTGDLEITVEDGGQLAQALTLLRQSYEQS